MAREKTPDKKSKETDDFFIEDYDEIDRATLKLFANGLVGKPDVRELVRRLGYENEQDLCEKENCKNLISFLFDGDFFENFGKIQEKVNRGRIGVH